MSKKRSKKNNASGGSQAQQNQQKKELTFAERMGAWIRGNQKLVMAILLLLLAPTFAFPLTAYLGPDKGYVIDSVYGRDVTTSELQTLSQKLQLTDFLTSDPAGYPIPERFFKAPLTLGSQQRVDPLDFLAYHAKAERLGLRVSDAELVARIRELWRKHASLEQAREEIAGQTAAAPNAQSQVQALVQAKRADWEASDTFDVKSWRRIVNRMQRAVGLRMGLRDVDSILRDVFLVEKLEQHLLSSVTLEEKEVFDKYIEEHQERKFSWISATPTDALREKVGATITEDRLEPFYTARIDSAIDDRKEVSFQRDFALQASYVLIPREHFVAEAKQSITDADVETYYKSRRSEFRRPSLRSDETTFMLRTEAEQKAFEEDLFFSLEEVAEKAREKVIEQRADREWTNACNKIRDRLMPPKSQENQTPATPEELAKEFAYIRHGETDWTNQEDAEDAFGEAYLSTVVSGWFATAARERGRVKIDPPTSYRDIPDEDLRVIYPSVATREAGIPRFNEVAAEVKDALVTVECLKLINTALEKKAEELGDGGLESLVGTQLSVTLPDGSAVDVPFGPVEISSGFSKRARHGGQLQVWETPEPSDSAEDEGEEEDEEELEPEEVAHASSAVLLDVGFSLDAVKKSTAATHEIEGAGYLIRLDDQVFPNSGSAFLKMRDRVAAQLLRERQQEYFAEWRKTFYQESRNRALAGDDAASEDLASTEGESDGVEG